MKKYILGFIILVIIMPIIVSASESGTFYDNNSTDNDNVSWLFEDGTLTISTIDDQRIYAISSLGSRTTGWYYLKNDIKKIIISDGIDIINPHAFEDYSNLEEVVFPKSMGGEISSYAFNNCSKLKKINISEGLMRIGDYAFYGTSITEVELPITLDWTYDHSFPEGTVITRPAEYDEIIAAGTAGKFKARSREVSGEGKASNNTCYNKTYYATYYDDTAYWKLMKDGTLILYGTEVIEGYSGSRVPWGCYKNQVKKIIVNDDITGNLSIKSGSCKNNRYVKIAVYASKPVSELMNRRIKIVKGSPADCREDCITGYRNLETIVFNRGLETIGRNALLLNQGHANDVYISKYVKTIDEPSVFVGSPSSNQSNTENNVHINISYEDYNNNGYSYIDTGLTEGFFKDDGSLNEITGASDRFGKLISDVDDTYVSINDTSAPDTIDVDGKTYYKYETYKTNNDGVAKVSLPNDDVDYYAKVIDNDNNCFNLKTAYRIVPTDKSINSVIEADNNLPSILNNPKTGDKLLILLLIIVISLGLGTFIYNKKINSY